MALLSDLTDDEIVELASVGVTLSALPVIRKILARHNASFEAAAKREKDAYRQRISRKRRAGDHDPDVTPMSRPSPEPPSKPSRPPVMLEVVKDSEQGKKVEIQNARESRGHRIPDGWQPNVGHWNRAMELGYDRHGFEIVTEEFQNYWRSTAGSRGRKTSWELTFTNRLIDQAAKYAKGKTNGRNSLGSNLQGAIDLLDQQEERSRERDGTDLFQLPRLQQDT